MTASTIAAGDRAAISGALELEAVEGDQRDRGASMDPHGSETLARSDPSTNPRSRSRRPRSIVAATDMAMSVVEDGRLRKGRIASIVEQEVELVIAEQAEVVEVAAADQHPVVDTQDLGVGQLRMEEDLTPASISRA